MLCLTVCETALGIRFSFSFFLGGGGVRRKDQHIVMNGTIAQVVLANVCSEQAGREVKSPTG